MSLESESQVIIPVIGSCRQNYDASMVALRTCRATTTAKILIIGNNCTEAYQKDFVLTCDVSGCDWLFLPGQFNLGKTFNDAMDWTSGPYIAMAGCDTIFYPGWFSNLIALWETNPYFFALAPFSFHPKHPVFNRCVKSPEPRIWEGHAHCPGCQVLRRDGNYRYDEKTGWEIDSDFHQHMAHHGLREGVCLNSRVDHVQQIRDTLPVHIWRLGTHDQDHDYFMKKWGLS